MFPFIHVGSLNIGTYGLCILIGAVAGIGVALIRAKRRSFPVEDTLFLSFFALIGVGVGAKILYLITILPDLIEHFQEIFTSLEAINLLFTNGFVFYGGLIGAVLAMWWYTHHFKMDFWQSVELLIPSVPLVHAFGRIGCFCGGCCYGIPFDPRTAPHVPHALFFEPPEQPCYRPLAYEPTTVHAPTREPASTHARQTPEPPPATRRESTHTTG